MGQCSVSGNFHFFPFLFLYTILIFLSFKLTLLWITHTLFLRTDYFQRVSVMAQNLLNDSLSKKHCDVNVSISESSQLSNSHRSGEKTNKCNQCDYASTDAGNLRRHLKNHSGEKSNKCNQCDLASIQAGDLRRHLKMHSGKI